MKAIQSYWLNQKDKFIDYQAGWCSVSFNLFSWALSSLQLSRYFYQSELYTDVAGAELCYKLQLPYNVINTDLELVKQESIYWVENKIFTYSIQEEPFIHIDTDAYIFRPFSEKLLNSSIFAQNIEYNQQVYVSVYEGLELNALYMPPIIKRDLDGKLTAINAGIIGGREIGIFKKFKKFIKTFLERNSKILLNFDDYDFNPFIEQFLFKKFVEDNNINIDYFLDTAIGPKDDYKLANFLDLHQNNRYIHLMNYKNNLTVCEQMAQRLWLESPDMYNRVLETSRQLRSTKHFFEDSKEYSIKSSNDRIKFLQSFANTEKTLNNIEIFLRSTEDNRLKLVLNDCLQYEKSIQEFIKMLPDYNTLLVYWKSYSKKVNNLIDLGFDQFCQTKIRQSIYSKRISSEWCWVETNEFLGLGANFNCTLNLNIEPAYFEVILYIYIHQRVIREQLLDITSILILDYTEIPITVSKLIELLTEQYVKNKTSDEYQRVIEFIINRIKHFLYHGILEIIDIDN